MKHAKLYFVLLGLSAAVLLAGCASDTKPAAATAPAAVAEKGGAQLWSENCARCHNLHSPSHYSPAQWEVAVHSMRIKAGLTGDDARSITEFMKSASR
jgi:mono/diheme cytochrome c family protein